jgi:hypothetical protein
MAWPPGGSEPARGGDAADLVAQPDLRTQFEDLLNAVRAAEADWRFCDRLDLADRLWQARPRKRDK